MQKKSRFIGICFGEEAEHGRLLPIIMHIVHENGLRKSHCWTSEFFFSNHRIPEVDFDSFCSGLPAFTFLRIWSISWSTYSSKWMTADHVLDCWCTFLIVRLLFSANYIRNCISATQELVCCIDKLCAESGYIFGPVCSFKYSIFCSTDYFPASSHNLNLLRLPIDTCLRSIAARWGAAF